MTLPVAIGLALQLLFTSTPAATPEEANGDRAYLEADFTLALRHYGKALAEVASPSDRARLHISRALCWMALQESAKVTAALTEALENDPHVALDPERVAPELVDRFLALRSTLRGTLTVSAEPGSVQAVLDGVPISPLPYVANVSLGDHLVEARGANGEKVSQSVRVLANQNHRVVLEMPSSSSAPKTAPETAPSLQALAALRLNLSGSAGLSPEASVLMLYRACRFEGGVLLGSSPALVLRLGAQTPRLFALPLRLHATVNGVLFSQMQFGLLGPGISAGATWTWGPRWSTLLEWSGWQLYAARTFLNRPWTVSAALQWRFQ